MSIERALGHLSPGSFAGFAAITPVVPIVIAVWFCRLIGIVHFGMAVGGRDGYICKYA